jgi:hypothetical protein
VVSWSRTVQSICPDTTGVIVASQAAASASVPDRYTDPGPAAARAGRAGGQAAQGGQVDVDLDVDGLAVPAGQHPGGDQPPAVVLCTATRH